ncbi:MAG: tetratricopeptide repeat protein [Hyphomonadaceae bacterium]
MFRGAAPSLETGRIAARNGRYETARRAFEAAADRGEPAGFYELGLLYWYGRGAPKSLEKAVALFQLAADSDHADAQHQLALALLPRDRLAAEKWLLKAAEQNHPPAMTRLAELFADRDAEAAGALLARAAHLGHPQAMAALGRALAHGLGGPPDAAGGLTWLYAAVSLTGDGELERDVRALARALPARDIAAAQKEGRALAKKFRRA